MGLTLVHNITWKENTFHDIKKINNNYNNNKNNNNDDNNKNNNKNEIIIKIIMR